METTYLRIGTTYYKIVRKPLVGGKFAVNLQPWSVECIKQDHGKSFLSSIPKYDGFCFVPGHLDYKREIGRFYNSYHPFPHEPRSDYPRATLVFLNHVFGEQLDLGLDYLKILLLYPTQMLPILCLVSTERNTGKTTFLNFLKAIFGDNMTINSNEDFRSNFNAEWAHKLLIGVDETFLDRKEDSERIKGLPPPPLGKNSAKPVQNLQEVDSSFLALQDLHRRMLYPGLSLRTARGIAGCYRRPVIVLALGAPPFGQLLCPADICTHALNHIIFVNTGLVFNRRHFMQTSAVHPLPHFVRHPQVPGRLSVLFGLRRPPRLRFAQTKRTLRPNNYGRTGG